MLEQDITEKRKSRHAVTLEDFTPECVVSMLYDGFTDNILYTDFSKTILDPCCGIGNILLYAIKQRLKYCKSSDDIYNALSTIYGTELMEDNVEECRQNIISVIKDNIEFEFDEVRVQAILERNIVCTDTFKWDYEKWEPIKESYCEPLW